MGTGENLANVRDRWRVLLKLDKDPEFEGNRGEELKKALTLECIDIHEVTLISRILVTPQSPIALPSPKTDAEMAVESRLTLLENRLEASKMSAIGAFKKLAQMRPGMLEPSLPSQKCLVESIPQPDIILTISISSRSRPNSTMQTFKVKSEQKLSELRDIICCPFENALQYVTTRGCHPEEKYTASEGGITRQNTIVCSFFIIDGVFYSDTREGIDSTEGIRSWLREKSKRTASSGLTDVMRPMEEVSWLEISPSLHKPYLFIHDGVCEHTMTIDDMRLEMPYHHPLQNAEVFRAKKKRRRCDICEGKASWVTVNDRLAPENPCTFCNSCYRMMHYDGNRNLLYSDYRIYPYLYDS